MRESRPLFDEPWAANHSEYADTGFMENLNTKRVPLLEDARDGFLEV